MSIICLHDWESKPTDKAGQGIFFSRMVFRTDWRESSKFSKLLESVAWTALRNWEVSSTHGSLNALFIVLATDLCGLTNNITN